MHDRQVAFIVAEDEERMRNYLVRKVAELDASFRCVGTASDGEEALEQVERYLPDLLITDIKMPVLDGLDLVERLRQTNPDLRILIVSGYSEFEYARRAIEFGIDDYILKPVEPEKLKETLVRIRIKLESKAGKIETEFGLDRIGATQKEIVGAVSAYLRENYQRTYSLERLSATFGCKPAYLLRLYKKVTGRTPTQDLIRLRIERAKRLLVGHRHIEVKQVASAVGYEDPLYFSRLFKKETGLNPTAFRESVQPR